MIYLSLSCHLNICLIYVIHLSQEIQKQKLGRMQDSDYFEDFGEGYDEGDSDEHDEVRNKRGKGKKSQLSAVSSSGPKDKLMGELEQLALGDDSEVSLQMKTVR